MFRRPRIRGWGNRRNGIRAIASSAARRAAEADTYYSSQSGRVMKVPGALGLRIHDITCCALPPAIVKTHFGALQAFLAPFKPASAELPPHVVDLQAVMLATSPILACRAGPGLIPPQIKMVTVDVDCSSARKDGNGKDKWQDAIAAAKAAVVRGVAVRANLHHAFVHGVSGSTDPLHLQLVAATFADLGADYIVLCDTHGKADEDALEAAVESVLWVDVAGETMLARLGLRAAPGAQGLQLVRAASKLKLDIFDVSMYCPTDKDTQAYAAPLFSDVLRVLSDRKHGRSVEDCAASEKVIAQLRNN